MLRGFLVALILAVPLVAYADHDIDVFEAVEHHSVDNDGVNIHYVTMGEGPVMLFVHGFPNWWYDWRHQLAEFSDEYKVVAMDMRAYNKSDAPQGVEHYSFEKLMSDVGAVIDDLGEETVRLVAHDWGAGVAWRFAAHFPERVSHLVIFNLTHPTSYMKVREEGSPELKASMNYIKMIYESTEPPPSMTPKTLSMRYRDDETIRARYEQAYENCDLNSMLDYYRGLYPKFVDGSYGDVPKITMPVLQFHGLNDRAVVREGLRDTWNHIEKDYTLVTIPGVGHDPHHDATALVNSTMRTWLNARK